MSSTPHFSRETGEIAPLVLMPGDPRRAEHIARNRLDGAQLVSDVRGIGTWTGTLDGVPVTVTASGMGVPSMSIYATELFSRHGVRRICRVGTCGAFSPRVHVRDVVTLSLAPTFDMLAAAVAQARRGSGRAVHVGSVFTSDYFYHPRTDITSELSKLGTLAVEMEAAGLYAAAARNNAEALAVLTVSDHLLDHSADLTATERETMFEDALEVAVAALLVHE